MKRIRVLMLNIGWIFFDMGGVLVDDEWTFRSFALAIQRLLAAHGIELSFDAVERAQLEAIRGFGSITRSTIAALTHNEEVREKVYKELWKNVLNLDKPYPEARKVLSELYKGYKLGVIANQLPGARERLRRFGFLEFLSVCALSDELGISKPDEAIFTYALKAVGCRPEECVMVGDRIDNDIAPAKRLGMHTVRVKRGLFSSQQPKTEQELPDAVIGSLTELPGLSLLG